MAKRKGVYLTEEMAAFAYNVIVGMSTEFYPGEQEILDKTLRRFEGKQ